MGTSLATAFPPPNCDLAVYSFLSATILSLTLLGSSSTICFSSVSYLGLRGVGFHGNPLAIK